MLGASLSTSFEKAKSAFNIPLSDGSATINLPFLNWRTMKQKDKTTQTNFDNTKLDSERALAAVLNEISTNCLVYQNAQTALSNQGQCRTPDRKNSHHYQVRYQYNKNGLKDRLEALSTGYGSTQNVLNWRYGTLGYKSMVHKAMAGRCTPK